MKEGQRWWNATEKQLQDDPEYIAAGKALERKVHNYRWYKRQQAKRSAAKRSSPNALNPTREPQK